MPMASLENTRKQVLSAVKEERFQCARIAEQIALNWNAAEQKHGKLCDQADGQRQAAREIAAAIRNRKS